MLVASADGKQLFLLGGFNGVELQDCHVFDTTSNTWACCGSKAAAGATTAATAGDNATAQPGSGDSSSGSSSMALPFGRSVFGAAIHGSSAAAGGCGCGHVNHVVTFGGEVSPSDKGHAGMLLKSSCRILFP